MDTKAKQRSRGRVVLAAFAAMAVSVTVITPPMNAQEVQPEIESLAVFEGPDHWKVRKPRSAKIPTLYFRKGLYTIQIRLFGEGSDYGTTAEYLTSPSGTTMGHAPKVLGSIQVAGRRTQIYERGFPIDLGDPHIVNTGKPKLGREEYCFVKVDDKRFFVLGFSREADIPDPKPDAREAWLAFLNSFKLKT